MENAPQPFEGYRLIDTTKESPELGDLFWNGKAWLPRANKYNDGVGPYIKGFYYSRPVPKIKYGPIPSGFRLVNTSTDKPTPHDMYWKFVGRWVPRVDPSRMFFPGNVYITPIVPLPDGYRIVDTSKDTPEDDDMFWNPAKESWMKRHTGVTCGRLPYTKQLTYAKRIKENRLVVSVESVTCYPNTIPKKKPEPELQFQFFMNMMPW